MSKAWKVMVLPVALCATVVLASRARAQASAIDMAASTCPVDENQPRAVQEASVMIVEALNARTDSARRIPLLSASKVLSVPSAENAPNPGGRAYELGRVLVLWLDLETQPVVTSKGSIGFTAPPNDTAQKIDLSVWIDSAFKIVEKTTPSCASSIAASWRQHAGWFRLVQRAVRQANDGKLDSAAVVAAEAARIYGQYPYTSFVMAQVAEGRGDHKTAIAKYNEALELAKQDSAFAQVRQTTEAAIGKVSLNAARATTNPEDKKFYIAAATTAFTEIAAEPGGAKPGQEGLATVAALSGDPSVAQAAYKAVLSDPNATYDDLVAGGLTASGAEQMSDAIRLFRRAVEINPFQRDGLSDLGLLLTQADSAAAARPFVDRLLKVDPSNPNDYILADQVYASLQRSAQKAAKRYADQASATTDATTSKAYRDSAAAWADSATADSSAAIGFLNKKDAMAVGVRFDQWIPKAGGVTLGGVLTNAAPAAKTVIVHVDFLDKSGNTVTSVEVTVTLDPKGSKQFSLNGAGSGIMAFKYSPLS